MHDAITNAARDETVQTPEAFVVLVENMNRLAQNVKIGIFPKLRI
jgi:hypothetical protein